VDIQIGKIIESKPIRFIFITLFTKIKTINIHPQVTTIGNDTFSRCASLTKISIPSTVTTIGTSAFSFFSKLTTISLPDIFKKQFPNKANGPNFIYYDISTNLENEFAEQISALIPYSQTIDESNNETIDISSKKLTLTVPESSSIELGGDSFGMASIIGENVSLVVSGKSVIMLEDQLNSVSIKATEPSIIPFISFKKPLTKPIPINLSNIQNVKAKTKVFAFSITSSSDVDYIRIHKPSNITVSLEKYKSGVYSMAGISISNPARFLSQSDSSIRSLLENEEQDQFYLYVISPKSNESKLPLGANIGIIAGCVLFVALIVVAIIFVLRNKKSKIEANKDSDDANNATDNP